MDLKLALLFQLVLCIIYCKETKCIKDFTQTQSLNIGDYHRISLQPGPNSTLVVQSSQDKYNGFTIQLHTQLAHISLYNGSVNCSSPVECVTSGSSVGMVQLVTPGVSSYEFKASVGCVGGDCQTNITLLVAVVGFGKNDPIPGGCAQTSNLENDAELRAVLAPHSKLLYFQSAGISSFLCDLNTDVIDRLQYQVYRKCLPYYDFTSDTFFEAIEEMLFPGGQVKFQTLLSGRVAKRILFDSSPSAGEVYNIITVDSELLTSSAYVPVVSYGCQLGIDGDCVQSIPAVSVIIGVLMVLVGLFLCLLAHRLFHLEVYIFTSLTMTYWFFMLLRAVTDWSNDALAGGSVGLGVLSGIFLYIPWFFLGWFYLYVIPFGLLSGFLLTATVFFTPVGTLVSLFEINYVYALVLVCGCVVFMAVFVAFPTVLNIVSSSLVGSYTIIFGIGIFKRTILTDIVLRVVENASVPGFLLSPSSCQLELIDIILSALWVLLCLVGILTQSLLSWQRKRSFIKRRDRHQTNRVQFQQSYDSFPASPFKQLNNTMCLKREREYTRPLLSPSSGKAYGTMNY